MKTKNIKILDSSTNPRVSIVVPAFNREKYLSETIQSVLKQNYSPIELIVLDDGSTDNTVELLKSYGNKIIWDHHKNMGEASTVNKGLKMASGEILSVLSSDDILYENTVEEIVDFMITNPKISVVYPDWDKIDEGSRIIQKKIALEYDFKKMIKWNYCFPGPGTFFKKEVFINTKGRDKDFIFLSDYDFWIRAGLNHEFARIPKVLAGFREHSSSASSSGNPKRAEEHIRVMDKFYSLPGLNKEIQKLKKEAFFAANYYAGCSVGDNQLKLRRKYLNRSFRLFPRKYFCEYRKRFFTVFIPLYFPLIRSSWKLIKKYFIKMKESMT
jgi:glycosyltransferase involved in cell wall biosynthesis